MNDRELKTRLLEAAAQLPGVRAGVDPSAQAAAVVLVVDLWYTWATQEVREKPGPKRKGSKPQDLGL